MLQHLPMDHNWQDEQILKSKIGEVLLPLIHCTTIRAGVCDGSGPTRKPGFLEVPGKMGHNVTKKINSMYPQIIISGNGSITI